MTVSYLNKQSSVSQRMNQGDEQTERGSQPPALPSKQQAVITQAKRELMKMGTGTGASHQLKDLCTDRSSMLWIKSRTSGLFGYSSFQWKQKLLCCSRFCRTHIPFSSQILPLIPHTSDSYLLPERSFMPHCRRYLGIDYYLPIHLSTLPTLSWWTSNISQSLMQWKRKQSQALSATRPSSPTVVQNSFSLGILVHFRHVRLLLFLLINMHEDKSPYIS